MSQRKIEMHWTCSACGQQNLGRHVICGRCGDPKGANEPYHMPSDTASAATVNDPALLRLANAGANWRCAYCGSDQRRLDGDCAQCGASQSSGKSTAGERSPAARPLAPGTVQVAKAPRQNRVLLAVLGLFALVVVLGTLCVGFALTRRPSGPRSAYAPSIHAPSPPPPPRVLEGTVTRVTWLHTIHVERKHLVAHEGFAEDRPADAIDVRRSGMRVHHHDRVQQGTQTEQYTEQVPHQDTETYQEHVPCGEDCTDIPQQCSEHCSPDNNGFATCTTTCSGGGRSCSPRYCWQPATRQVTRYRTETRTREVPRFVEVPREAAWFGWRVWEWSVDRSLSERGTTEPPVWPSEDALAPTTPLGVGEEERQRRQSDYRAFIQVPGVPEHQEVLATVDELTRHAPGTRWMLEVHSTGQTRLLGPAPVEGDAGQTAPAGDAGQ